MIFSDNMRFGPHAYEHRHYILDNLRNLRFSPGVYVITEAKAPNLYEIYNEAWLLNPKMKLDNFRVLGIGYGYDDMIHALQELLHERLRL